MKISKRKIFGYILILVGIGLPLSNFLNMSYTELTKTDELEKYIQTSTKEDSKVEKNIEEYNKNIEKEEINFVDPFSDENYERQYTIYRNNPDKEFGFLEIPKLDIKMPIYLDASIRHLAKGAAHIDGTHLPVGEKGRSVIAGHRGFYRDLMFFHLDRLEKGDHVYVYRGEKVLDYIVDNSEIIFPYEWEKLKPIDNVDMLTLLTCEPKRPPSPKRLLVNCVRVEEEKVVAEENNNTKEVIKRVEVDNSVKNTKYVIYALTALLSLIFLRFLYKLIKYIIKRK